MKTTSGHPAIAKGEQLPVIDAPMTQAKWDSMNEMQKAQARDLSGLSRQLCGCEGWRVEVVTTYGEKRRFIVGRSTGWKPCHLEISRRNSWGGGPAEKEYQSIRKLYLVR